MTNKELQKICTELKVEVAALKSAHETERHAKSQHNANTGLWLTIAGLVIAVITLFAGK
ncbi:MAG: hypothetical protein ACOY0T_31225 [Myxococcota bacterium]